MKTDKNAVHASLTGNSTTSTKPFEKKKLLRRRRAEDRLRQKGIDLAQHKADRAAREEARKRNLESFLLDYDPATWKHKLEVRLVLADVDNDDFLSSFEESYAIYKKYQTFIHEDADYEISQGGYTRFLASSPLFVPTGADDGISPAMGSYHQQYLLDGKIIAVGVVDILPRCFSSKYFYYGMTNSHIARLHVAASLDPDWKFLSLGTYSALRYCCIFPYYTLGRQSIRKLREIAYTKELCKSGRPELHYYYMGFYLYGCPKMRYKGKFRPSDLLCDKTFQWVGLSTPLSELNKVNNINRAMRDLS